MERLAERMRPQQLDQWIGQTHLLAPGQPLRQAIESDLVSSMILYGPPGCGKTSLAHVIGKRSNAHVVRLHASDASVKDVRATIDQAQGIGRLNGQKTILFLDEIHRFTATQQDALLSAVEKGTIILIGATTEHPGFAVQRALLSRVTVFQLHPLSESEIVSGLQCAITDPIRGYGAHQPSITAEEGVLEWIAETANGDLRYAYQMLEWSVQALHASDDAILTRLLVERVVRRPSGGADKSTQYDVLSAFHKSVRGSSDAAVLWFLYGIEQLGMDPRIFLRRLTVACSEDIGMAQPQAMGQALQAWEAFDKIGWPEAKYNCVQAIIFAVESPKSNAIPSAIQRVSDTVANHQGRAEVPHHLRNQPLEKFVQVKGSDRPPDAGYRYPHDYPGHYVKQAYVPLSWKDENFFQPSNQGSELKIQQIREQRKAHR